MTDLHTMTKTQLIEEVKRLRAQLDRAMGFTGDPCPPDKDCETTISCEECREQYIMEGE